VTDAAVVLGMLPSEGLAGGLALDVEAARRAVDEVADAVGMDTDRAAHGILAIATANMANAIREIAVERGEDVRASALIAFGGMGPLFGTMLARELGIQKVIIPVASGVFSAVGLLSADVVRTAARTSIREISDESLDDINALLAELFGELAERSAVHGDGEMEVALDLRYVGQEHHLTLELPSDGGVLTATSEEIRSSFASEYERLFNLSLPLRVEAVASRATTRTVLAARPSTRPDAGEAPPAETTETWSFRRGERLTFDVVSRRSMDAGAVIAGPALVLEGTATTYIDHGFEGAVDDDGNLVLADLGS
jgi:N-methylhydantoinase A